MTEDETSRILEDVVKEIPLECILLETDAPYMKPKKPDHISGKQWKKAANTSLILPMVVENVAEIMGVAVKEVVRVTVENVRRVFNFDL